MSIPGVVGCVKRACGFVVIGHVMEEEDQCGGGDYPVDEVYEVGHVEVRFGDCW